MIETSILGRATGRIEPGRLGRWRVERFEVPESSIEHVRLMLQGRDCSPGEYTRLVRVRDGTPYEVEAEHDAGTGTIVMSDTDAELNDLAPLFWALRHYDARRVVINGLGLGCALLGTLGVETVEHVDVVEVDADVIELVGAQFVDGRVTFHLGDAFEYAWPRGTRWDVAWHDVWDDLSTYNLNGPEANPGTYARLNRRYGGRVRWQGAWGQGYLEARR